MPTQDAASVNTATWSRYEQNSARNIPLLCANLIRVLWIRALLLESKLLIGVTCYPSLRRIEPSGTLAGKCALCHIDRFVSSQRIKPRSSVLRTSNHNPVPLTTLCLSQADEIKQEWSQLGTFTKLRYNQFKLPVIIRNVFNQTDWCSG